MALLTALTNTIAVDGTGKLPVGLIPDSVTGALNYQGTWNAATNTPTLANGTGTKGHYYKVAVQGTFNIGGIDFWNLGDIISYNGSTWDRIDGGINEVVEGPQGPAGPPGPLGQTGGPGPAGQTLYSWFAYANSPDGIAGFTSGAWTNQTYLGIAVNKTTPVESQNPSDYTWAKMQGPPGPQGTTGPAGAAGAQGNSLYTWIAYADNINGTVGFTTGENLTGKQYIGIANNKTSSVEGTNPSDYTWSKIQGEDGIPGTPGANGQTTYTWFAYANSADGTVGFTTGAWTNQAYLGLAVNKLTAVESTNPADYTWSKMQGDQGTTGATGAAGPQGNSMYTWIAYANSADGTLNFTTGASSGHTYIGIANNQTSSTESTNPALYTWSKIQGDAGVPGTPGTDGAPTYTWFAYANNSTGTVGFTTGAWTNQTYLGLAANKLTSVESTNPADYTWSKIQGNDGPQGPSGQPGTRGASRFNTNGVIWSDGVATNTVLAQYPSGVIENDEVTITDGATYVMTKYWNGGAWVPSGQVIDGNLIVTGSLSAAKISSGVLSASTNLTVGTAVRSGTTMGSGSGAYFEGNGGRFTLGDTSKNITYDGSAFHVNGPIILTSNINTNAISIIRTVRKSTTTYTNSYWQTFGTQNTWYPVDLAELAFPADPFRGDRNIMHLSWWPTYTASGTDWEIEFQTSVDYSFWSSAGFWYVKTPTSPTSGNGQQDVCFYWDWGAFSTNAFWIRLVARNTSQANARLRGYSLSFMEYKR